MTEPPDRPSLPPGLNTKLLALTGTIASLGMGLSPERNRYLTGRAEAALVTVKRARDELVVRLDHGWAWSAKHPDDPRAEAHVVQWEQWLRWYEAVEDAIANAERHLA